MRIANAPPSPGKCFAQATILRFESSSIKAPAKACDLCRIGRQASFGKDRTRLDKIQHRRKVDIESRGFQFCGDDSCASPQLGCS